MAALFPTSEAWIDEVTLRLLIMLHTNHIHAIDASLTTGRDPDPYPGGCTVPHAGSENMHGCGTHRLFGVSSGAGVSEVIQAPQFLASFF